MAVVAQVETFLDKETVTLFKLEDLKDIIIDNLGEDIWEAVLYFTKEKANEEQGESPNIVDYVEDGIFTGQIRESGVIQEVGNCILGALKEQDYLKKSKSLNNFEYPEDEMVEVLDEKLTPGMMNYFGE